MHKGGGQAPSFPALDHALGAFEHFGVQLDADFVGLGVDQAQAGFAFGARRIRHD